jgi:hypothetical protein
VRSQPRCDLIISEYWANLPAQANTLFFLLRPLSDTQS